MAVTHSTLPVFASARIDPKIPGTNTTASRWKVLPRTESLNETLPLNSWHPPSAAARGTSGDQRENPKDRGAGAAAAIGFTAPPTPRRRRARARFFWYVPGHAARGSQLGARARARRFVVIVLDGVGVGALPDASRFGDEGTNTLLHTAEAVGALELPTLRELGLGNVQRAPGLEPVAAPRASWEDGRALPRQRRTKRALGNDGMPAAAAVCPLSERISQEIIGAFVGKRGSAACSATSRRAGPRS